MKQLGRINATLTLRQIAFAVALVALTAAILGASQFLIGPNTATSGYLTILFLLSVVRAASWRARFLATGWCVAVALLGFAVGGLGMWAVLAALVAVSLVQGFVTLGETAFLTRSPVNLLAFASLSQGGAEVWQVLLGSAIGAGAIWVFASVAKERDAPAESSSSLAERIGYGIATAAGSLLIVIGADLIGFVHVSWALLSFSIILSVGSDERASRSRFRILGSAVGAILSMLIALLPSPIPTIGALACAVLCVAYVSAGNYAFFMLFLTPAILLTAQSEYSLPTLGLYRLEALTAATVIALLCSFLLQKVLQLGRYRRVSGPSNRHPSCTTLP